MRLPCVATLACAGFVLPISLTAQGVSPRSSTWTVDDLLTEEAASQFAISPDGRWVTWVRSTVDAKDGTRAANLWITRIADGESWPLTRGQDRHGSPRWSPDGRLLAFTSSRKISNDETDDGDDGGSQLWLLRLAGGEPWPLTTGVRGLRDFAWKGAGSDTIVFAADEGRSRLAQARKQRKDAGRAVEDTLEAPPVRLWSVAVASKRVRRLTTNDDWIQEMALSPDGRRAVIRVARSLSYGYDNRVPPETYLADLATGERRRVMSGEKVVPRGLEWAADGGGFYFTYGYSPHPVYWDGNHRLMGYYDVAADRLVRIDLDWPRGVGGGFEVAPRGFVTSLADGFVNRVARYTRRGDRWQRAMLEGEHVPHLWSFSLAADGSRIAYATSTATTPAQPYVGILDGARIREPRRLVQLNTAYAQKPKPRVERLRWPGARGDTVEGLLYYPLGWSDGRRYPVVVSPHGGPASRDRDAWVQGWHDPYVLINQRGAFVFRINYHGSSGYGLEWVESIAGGSQYYDLPVADIERGVDLLIARGLVHADSVAAAGWSNGAILSTALTVEHPERYRALVAGAGDVEWISDWGNVDFGAAFDNYYFGASPLEDPQRYIALSPFFRLDRVRAPTLILFGTEDRNVPPSQGWSHYRALQQLGHTPVRFVLFPGEPHGLRQLGHQRRKVEEELRWLERHLWGRPDTASPALADGSPLAALLARRDAARDGDRYGVRVNGVLVPETVRKDDVTIGRFEVTRAQWREFDDGYAFPTGTDNLPVGGVSFERAQAYVSWLSERAGVPFRLPTAAELERLGSSGGLTLDYWAGYRPNLDDAERLARLVQRLPGDAPLLLPVGGFPGDASGPDPRVFDAGGNVAEWTTGADGTARLVGGSADCPKDADCEAGPAYRGVRVVRTR